MPFDADDLAAFFDDDMPGYRLAALAGGAALPGLLSDRYGEVLGGLVAGHLLEFRVASSAVAAFVAGTTGLTIDGTAYTVAEIQPHGAGTSVLRLEAA